MFLPTEGLYAEVLRRPGLVTLLQDDFRVVVAGPTTLAALLNALRMGFRTLALQQRHSEIWTLLGDVKREFGKFGEVIGKVQRKLDETSKVIETEVGYSGGTTENATYQQVCTGTTGHAEVVRLSYDPQQVSYEQLLDVFWSCHDPTQRDRQGPDVGTQYRSAILFHTPQQEQAARASKTALDESGRFQKPLATEISSAANFYRAEEYHQQYLEKRGQANCHL